MKTTSPLILLALMLSAGVLFAVGPQDRTLDPAIEEFLITQEAEIEKGDLVLKGSLVAIVPSSHRLIVKTDEEEKTLALALSENVKIKEDLNLVGAAALKRGDVLVLILGSADYQVKEIHKYKVFE